MAFLLCVGFGGYGVMRKLGSGVVCPLTGRYNLKVNYVEYINIILGSVVTLLAVYLTNKYNLKNSEINHLRYIDNNKTERKVIKSEELYMIFNEWEKQVGAIYLLYYQYFTQHIDYEVLTKSCNRIFSENKKSVNSFDRISMLVNMYFPELKFELDLINERRGILGKFLSEDAVEKYSPTDFLSEWNSFDKDCKNFTEKLIVLVNKL